eukprot:SAG11_NODE_5025_length_1687_cov_1.195844_1_plen_184_part_10
MRLLRCVGGRAWVSAAITNPEGGLAFLDDVAEDMKRIEEIKPLMKDGEFRPDVLRDLRGRRNAFAVAARRKKQAPTPAPEPEPPPVIAFSATRVAQLVQGDAEEPLCGTFGVLYRHSGENADGRLPKSGTDLTAAASRQLARAIWTWDKAGGAAEDDLHFLEGDTIEVTELTTPGGGWMTGRIH